MNDNTSGEDHSSTNNSPTKSFKLDMSGDANRRGLLGISMIVCIKLLGSQIGSYLVAGIIMGIVFAGVEYYFSNKN